MNTAQLAEDSVGRVERAGVEFLPVEARDSSPRNLAVVFVGAGFTLTSAVAGWLFIGFGLNFWQAVSAGAVGLVIGTAVVVPTALIGPRTGTNMTVASSADFGIRGRFIGSVLSLLIALLFAALTVWTSGDALVAASSRLLGTPDTGVAHAASYAVVAAGMAVVALYGHATIVAVQKLVAPVVGAVMVVGFFVFSSTFDATSSTGQYALGDLWPSWILAVVFTAAAPISYAPTISDYTRRISPARYKDRSIVGALAIGLLAGGLIPIVFGAYTASATVGSTSSGYVSGLVMSAPSWYVAGIVLMALLGGVGQGVLCIYASGLDIEGLLPRLKRVHTTAITAALAVALLYLGVFVFDAADSVSTMSVVLNTMVTPWAVIMIIGLVRRRHTGYDTDDLQVFAAARTGGIYWYSGGWNVDAVLAWVIGSAFGVLTVTTPTYVGPLAGIAGGIDLSTLGSGCVAGLCLIALSARVRRRSDRVGESKPELRIDEGGSHLEQSGGVGRLRQPLS
ncbi:MULTISPECIES: cytosine permease [Nocardiaceae]|uniref:Purine-cytosine permease-like protein n=1 Tax=Rhodococcoides corynebacterioides TaxID=53972 RepID=A0ABS2KYK2_9NOCA|nr:MULTISPECIES: cytosine permease [Rhodococcus]MBM7417014.1 purine-cytosine permease-like protein [Rhodococcus corynebacterioides]MBP1115267.1 purine-cytosine permease-like protein [Rhodococcus sp. PvP016]